MINVLVAGVIVLLLVGLLAVAMMGVLARMVVWNG